MLSGSSQNVVGNRVSVIDKEPLRIVITDSPTNANMESHITDLLARKVKHVARASEPTYETQTLERMGIRVHDLQFDDGAPPPEAVRNAWLDLVERCFIKGELASDERISVHCIAGLGRAPLLVAIALIEYCNMDAIEAIEFVRNQRHRRAINRRQVTYLEEYKPTRRRQDGGCAPCTIM
ncbi:Protein tyrosine phosphatase type IVA 3 [Hondaea fermentalgiana]|uniref:protein-tyrosine-phosphatase n=1 Tax=Hondaea fermentalgiana TaxID=2315210 RepID=A0A2R5GAV4_9STRA|nr:Protein tyrosine phosphatase type IVA 3 [Hondaea fermentalgiana]|eukprot:GBG27449.1 Protein tyrosine phosphatase type IVA 3 [Hondaea fermentalgiana]